MVGSPPPLLDATMISRLSLLHSLPRLASTAPLARLIFAQCEWPDMLPPGGCALSRFLGVLGLFGPLRKQHRDHVTDLETDCYHDCDNSQPVVLAFARCNQHHEAQN